MTERLCECHGEPMQRNGAKWRCRVKKRARDQAYLLTDRGRVRARRFRLNELVSRREAQIKRLEELIQQ